MGGINFSKVVVADDITTKAIVVAEIEIIYKNLAPELFLSRNHVSAGAFCIIFLCFFNGHMYSFLYT